MKPLIEAGADVNDLTETGRTALMLAAYWGHANIVQLLLEKGADVNVKDKDGYTAVDYARSQKHKGIEEMVTKAKPVSSKDR
jgi:ankyrin repeat protein